MTCALSKQTHVGYSQTSVVMFWSCFTSTSHRHPHRTDARYHFKKWQHSKTAAHNSAWWISLINFIRYKELAFKNNLTFWSTVGIPCWCTQQELPEPCPFGDRQCLKCPYNFFACYIRGRAMLLVLLSPFCHLLADSWDLNALHIWVVSYQY